MGWDGSVGGFLGRDGLGLGLVYFVWGGVGLFFLFFFYYLVLSLR